MTPFHQVLHAGARRFHLAQDLFRVAEKLLSRLREHHAPADPIEQTAAHVLFQRLDRVADGGLREK
jgi:hypothetical protein